MEEEKDVANQTGPICRVKSALVIAGVAIAASTLLAACAAETPWHSTYRSSAEANDDYKNCNADAQDAILTHAGSQPAAYSGAMPPSGGAANQSGANIGENPMALHDRVVTENHFDHAVADCMQDKGYTQGKPPG
jgi:hypothetical protein